MIKLITLLFMVFVTNIFAQEIEKQELEEVVKQEFEVKVITSVESIVPNGLDRSRLISASEERDYKKFTSSQPKDDNTRNKSKRKDIRVKEFEETKLLNF